MLVDCRFCPLHDGTFKRIKASDIEQHMRMMHSDEYYRDDQAVIHHEEDAGLISHKKNPLKEFAKAMGSGGLGKRPH